MVDVWIVNLLHHQGTTVTVHGTAESDGFVFDASASTRQVAVNGVSYEFTEAEADTFLFDGLDGNDDVQVVGSEEADTATLRPSAAFVRGSGYSLAAVNVESSTFDGGGGQDLARIYGSRGVNTFTFGGEEAAAGIPSANLTGGGAAITAVAETVYVQGKGGMDMAELCKLAGSDLPVPFWRWAQMSGEEHVCRVADFHTVDFQEGPSELATFSPPPLGSEHKQFDAEETAVETADLTKVAAGQADRGPLDEISLQDLARLLWLTESERTRPKNKIEIEQIDRIFAYWE